MARRRRLRVGTVAGLAGLVACLAGGPSPVSGRPSGPACVEPYAPLATASHFSGSQDHLPAVAGEDKFFERIGLPALDTDGDGSPDEIVAKHVSTDPSQLIRGDGTLTFQRSGAVVESPVNAGDLDGDGRDEIALTVGATSGTEFYIVPGPTSPGVHDPADIGIRMAARAGPTPDRDGDGVVDLVDVQLQGPTSFRSGAAIIAVGAPGDARNVEPFLTIPGAMLGFADLGGAHPVIVTGEASAPDAGLIRITDDAGTRIFTTAPHGFDRADGSDFGFLQVLRSDAGTYLTLDQSGRSGGEAFLWRVDEPCSGLAGTPTAPGAVSVEGSPNYTG